jgi:signal transduction histidine kinase
VGQDPDAAPAGGRLLDLKTLRARLSRLLSEDLIGGTVLILLPLLTAWVNSPTVQSAGARWIFYGGALLQSLVLVVHRRFPFTALCAVLAIDLALVLTVDAAVLFGIIGAGSGLGARGGRLQNLVGVPLVLVSLFVGLVGFGPNPASMFPAFVILAVGFLAFWAGGRFEAHQRARMNELRARSDRLEEEREIAVRRERVLLARELHDILNHSVTAMVLDAEAGAETGSPAEAKQTLHRVARTGRASLAELRRLLGVLRTAPTEHDQIAPPPTLADIDALVLGVPGPSIAVVREGSVRSVDASIELAAYRVVQESLTNVVKHAGAVPVELRLSYLPDALEVHVHNAPPASVPPSSGGTGTGLVGMRERVELLGGTFHAGPSASGGFDVFATMPVRREA